MSGSTVDIQQLVRSILDGSGGGPWSSGGSQGDAPGSGAAGGFQQRSHDHLEPQLLKVLDLVDLDDSPHPVRLDLKNNAGHTMLHYACSLGFHRFVAALIARGANPNSRDKGGYTPLHQAAINDHPEIVRRLMLVRADPTIRTLSGLTAADVARSRSVLKVLEKSERQARRYSRSSLHSRTNSATSLRSLWEPMTKVKTHDEPIIRANGSDEESLEYTSGDFEDEESDGSSGLDLPNPNRLTPGEDESSEEDSQSETEYPTALRNQFQQQLHQWQQAFALQFQNLPHLPQMPQMPQMPQVLAFPGRPVFPGYQQYLQQAPFMRRMQSFMPGMVGRGAETEDDVTSPKPDASWWNLSSYMGSTSPPPAYEEIFPMKHEDQKGQDEKQSMAALAAADAAADMKCASMYDQPGTETPPSASESEASSISRTSVKAPIPPILKIGRKNAITKEQQENFLRAREEKMKRLGDDPKLFLIWVSNHIPPLDFLLIIDILTFLFFQIPLLILVLCAMVYSYVPSFLPFVVSFLKTLSEFAGRLWDKATHVNVEKLTLRS